MNNNFLGIRGLYKTHMDELKPFNSKSVTYTYIGYTEHNSRGQPIVRGVGGGGVWSKKQIRTHKVEACLLDKPASQQNFYHF